MSLIRETRMIFRRYLRLTMRDPGWVLTGLTLPIVFLVFYGPLVTRMIRSPRVSEAAAWQTYVAGVLVQLGLFGAAFVGFTIITEWRSGILDRFRVTPASRLALLLGRVLRDMLAVFLQALILIVVAIPFGLRVRVGGVVLALALIAVMAASLSAISYTLGLALKSEMALGPILNSAAFPLLLLSGIFLPMSFAPGWLDWLSRLIPFRYIVDAIRAAFLGQFQGGPLLRGAAVTVGLAVASIALAVRTFRRQSG
jgi:ABC-2 type transport system permease protein